MARKSEAKLEWLRAIYEGKSTLFGAFSDTLTKDVKRIKWTEVHNLAQALGLVPPDKDYKYTRDTFWQNMRKAAVKKRDNSRQTGSGQIIFTKIDEAIYGIIGKDTPTLDGLLVPESFTETAEASDAGASTLPENNNVNKENIPPKRIRKQSYEEKLKLKKLELTVKWLEKKNYLLSLQIKKTKRELGVDSMDLAMESTLESTGMVSMSRSMESTQTSPNLTLDEEFLEDNILEEI